MATELDFLHNLPQQSPAVLLDRRAAIRPLADFLAKRTEQLFFDELDRLRLARHVARLGYDKVQIKEGDPVRAEVFVKFPEGIGTARVQTLSTPNLETRDRMAILRYETVDAWLKSWFVNDLLQAFTAQLLRLCTTAVGPDAVRTPIKPDDAGVECMLALLAGKARTSPGGSPWTILAPDHVRVGIRDHAPFNDFVFYPAAPGQESFQVFLIPDRGLSINIIGAVNSYIRVPADDGRANLVGRSYVDVGMGVSGQSLAL